MRSLLILFMFCTANFGFAQSFKSEQMKFEKVQQAYTEKYRTVDSLLQLKHISPKSVNIFLRAFKDERVLEVWGKNAGEEQFQIIITYPFCAVSGELGPKRREGDGQIPEGVYTINHFNPMSNFFLSLGVSYPNRSDAILGKKGSLGGEIYIHGNCVTIGCIPITDDLIKELYVIAVEARNNGQIEIPVHIFPSMLTPDKVAGLKARTANDMKRMAFWNTLVPVFEWFENTHTVPSVTIDEDGAYSVH
jgi:murein L,D-transpeptidase YafK